MCKGTRDHLLADENSTYLAIGATQNMRLIYNRCEILYVIFQTQVPNTEMLVSWKNEAQPSFFNRVLTSICFKESRDDAKLNGRGSELSPRNVQENDS